MRKYSYRVVQLAYVVGLAVGAYLMHHHLIH
jgi:hypothetical protein